jgi:hypothetical protein
MEDEGIGTRISVPWMTGVVEGNVFWEQATKFTSSLVKTTPSTLTIEERITELVLHAFDELVRIAKTRSDIETFMAVDENGKNFCDYWSSFAKRVETFSSGFFCSCH